MVSRSAVAALLLLIASGVSAQSSAEFGRASGGEVALTTKGSTSLSGSMEMSLTNGNSPGYGLTLGGELVPDRLWFFVAGSRQELSRTRFARLDLPENATMGAVGARAHGQVGASHDFSAFFEAARRPEISTPFTTDLVPSSFLSLRYSGLLSSNMLVSGSFVRSSRTRE
jgi:hypothetical protein